MAEAAGQPFFTDDAQSTVAWLDAAAALLNPSGVRHHRASAADIDRLFEAIPPPPPSLQERWATTVWPARDEPFPVYLVRCLAHHSALTGLSPHTAVHQGAEVCRVVGLRLRPFHADLAQTGWDPLPCPHCRAQFGRTDGGGQAMGALPLRYGGAVCGTCRRPLPLRPVWTRRFYLVLQRASGRREAAVAMGDGLGPALALGQSLRVLLYTTRTDSGQPLTVVHAAEPAAGALLPLLLPSHHGGLAAMPFADLCRGVCPAMMGQQEAKGLLLLSAVHSLYRGLRAGGRPGRLWRPLHLLLLGPTKGGKSTLLQAIGRLYGPHADTVAGTVVQRPGGDGGEGPLAASLPALADGLLLSRAATGTAALLVDDLGGGPAALLQVRQLLERGTVCTAGPPPTAASAALSDGLPLLACGELRTAVQLTACSHEEGRLAGPLAGLFPLVARVTPRLSLAHSATIGQGVIAASVSRSRSASASSSLTSRREGSAHNSGGSFDGAFHLTAEALLAAVAAAPDPEWLEACVARGGFAALYTAELQRQAGLLEAGRPPACSQLPPPASQRGSSGGSSAPGQQLLMAHLGPLASLTQARILLAGPNANAVAEEDIASDVWALYLHHLGSVARQADFGRCPQQQQQPYPSYQQQQQTAYDLSAMLRASGGGDDLSFLSAAAGDGVPLSQPRSSWSPGPPSPAAGYASGGLALGVKRGRSKKATRLLLVDLMLRDQQGLCGAAGSEAVCPYARAEVLFLSLGGPAAVGEPLDMVMGQLQHEGCIIRRPAGWHVTGM